MGKYKVDVASFESLALPELQVGYGFNLLNLVKSDVHLWLRRPTFYFQASCLVKLKRSMFLIR